MVVFIKGMTKFLRNTQLAPRRAHTRRFFSTGAGGGGGVERSQVIQ